MIIFTSGDLIIINNYPNSLYHKILNLYNINFKKRKTC